MATVTYRVLADGTVKRLHPAVAEAENLQYDLYGGGVIGGPLRWLGLRDCWLHHHHQRAAVAAAQRRVAILG